MKIERQTNTFALAAAAAVVLVVAGSAYGARPPLSQEGAAVASASDVVTIERAANGRLLAVGRLDSVSRSRFAVSVLGQKFYLMAGSGNRQFIAQARIGQPVALFGDLNAGKYFVDAVLPLEGQYIQGASKVYLRGSIRSVDRNIGVLSIGGAQLDTTSLVSRKAVDRIAKGAIAAVIGTQPSIGGKVLVESIRRIGSVDASLGTGRTDASLGTGKTDASLGTGRTDASLGTGKSSN